MPSRILIAPDKFKGTYSSLEVAEAIQRGILKQEIDVHTSIRTLADGGEGSARILTELYGGVMLEQQVMDPLGRPIMSSFGWIEEEALAVIEMAAASGLSLLKPDEYDCLKASSYGTGELLRAALLKGATQIILCLGGSASSDAGIGMAAACGYAFWDEHNILLPPTAASLAKIRRISYEDWALDWSQLKTLVLCDVDNQLLGERGAVNVFAPQKGASAVELRMLNEGFENFSKVCNRMTNKNIELIAGSGAAGGLGAASLWFFDAEIRSGAEFILDSLSFDRKLKDCDWVVTGEGKIDEQTLEGKLAIRVLERAKEAGKQTLGVFASSDFNEQELRNIGFDLALILDKENAHLRQAKVSIWDIENKVSGVANLIAQS